MNQEWSPATPPFDAGTALASLKRLLRELGLAERAGVFERRGIAIARVWVVTVDATLLRAAVVKKPSRSSPEWRESRLESAAEVRDFAADLKKKLALWGDRDD